MIRQVRFKIQNEKAIRKRNKRILVALKFQNGLDLKHNSLHVGNRARLIKALSRNISAGSSYYLLLTLCSSIFIYERERPTIPVELTLDADNP